MTGTDPRRLLGDAALFERLVALRRDLHRHAELSWREERTAARICEALDELGIPYRQGVGGTGIIAELPGPAGVPAIALRADMDALPIQEETGLDFASVQPGVMHACGHDGHVAMLVGAAALLVAVRDRPAPVRLIFQPAEEDGTGAPAMIAAGALDDVALIFGGHIDRLYEPGVIAVTEGPVNAASDEFLIELSAPGGHGARPHETSDPVVAGAALVAALQTIVSREVDPTAAAVVSVGVFQAGSAPNVIANRARLEGTLRAHSPDVRAQLHQAVQRIAEGVGQAHGTTVQVSIRSGTPAVVNAPGPTALAQEAAAATVGGEQVRPLATGNMGAEDFGFYLERAPGCYVRFGARPAGPHTYPAHSSRFDWDETALAVGAAYFRQVALVACRHVRGNRPADSIG